MSRGQQWSALGAGLVLTSLALLACPVQPAGPTPYTPSRTVCGNDDRQGREVCDGSDLDGRSCADLGFGVGVLGCKPTCRDFDRSGCGAPAGCGDGIRDGVELCDGSDLGIGSCEELGYGAGTLGCLGNCAEFDTSSCGSPPDCGDGDRDGVEVCDGEDFGGLRCTHLGYGGGDLACAGDCLAIDTAGCSVACVPDCGNRACGPDPVCGESCGTCATGSCNSAGQCISNCTADCAGRECGADPVCGLSCGSCSSGECNADGRCVAGCTPDCGSRVCGPDPLCGLSCGTCSDGACDNGQCVSTCTPDCAGRACGPDPLCGEPCGSCPNSGDICVAGQCQGNDLCTGYTVAGRAASCDETTGCSGAFECSGTDLQSSLCMDQDPCAATPAARCCGAGEFCGTSSGMSFLPSNFCCVPGEVLGQGLFGVVECVDAGLDIACSGPSDCPSGWGIPHCGTSLGLSVCVECLDNGDCDGDSPGCDTATGTCVQCTSSSHCTASGLTACDLDSHTCVECVDASTCGGDAPHCSDGNSCVSCTEHSHCSASGVGPYCVNAACVACRDSNDCSGSTPFCRYGNYCSACPDSFLEDLTCTSLSRGGRACYPMGFVQPTADECSGDGECDEGYICGAPAGSYQACVLPCQ